MLDRNIKLKAYKKKYFLFVLLFIVENIIIVMSIISLIVLHNIYDTNSNDEHKNNFTDIKLNINTNTNTNTNTKSNIISDIHEVNFQNVVDDWVNSIKGNSSVLIYDIEKDQIVGSYNEQAIYNIASLYKLFVVYEGYKMVRTGEWQGDEPVGMTGKTVLECLDLAIRESDSVCAEALLVKIGREELNDNIKNDYGMTNTIISGVTSNAEDVLKIMKMFYDFENNIDDTLLSKMKDSFLNQPETNYDWRQGLPSGFETANVYNKVGWDYNFEENYWNAYHDVAIVEFPGENRHFIVVVMTNFIPYKKISEFGTIFEEEFFKQNGINKY